MNIKWFTTYEENPYAIPGDPNPEMIGINIDNVSAIMSYCIDGKTGTAMRLIDGQLLHLRDSIAEVIKSLE